MSDDEKRDPGAYIGREPELAAETIRAGSDPTTSASPRATLDSSGEGAASDRVQGRE